MRIRQTEEISAARLQEMFSYDKEQGIIRVVKSSRKVLPHPETGSVSVYDGTTKLRRNILYKNLAYTLGSGEYLPEDKKVLALDLDENNINYSNLKIVDRAVYGNIQIALRNISGGLRIAQHPQDRHAYVVYWLEQKTERCLIFYDIAAAENQKQKKLLEFVKLVNNYIRSE